MLNNYLPKYFNRNARNYELKKQKLNICEYESNLIKKYGIPLLRNEVYEKASKMDIPSEYFLQVE